MFFSEGFVRRLADDIVAYYASFDRAEFLTNTLVDEFEDMALKRKMRHVTQSLHASLPDDFAKALPVLLAVAPNYTSFDGMVFSDYVACYGLHDWDLSLPALREMTRTISAEFAIRPFLRDDRDRAMPYLYAWAEDPDAGVRRLASEGSRPRLPWGIGLPAFKKDPTPILPILEQLKDDSSEDVRRSVANNLNDIAKDNPAIVLDIAERWYGQSEEGDRVVKHACRTLLKAGNLRALRLFGFAEPVDVHVNNMVLDPQELAVGEDIVISYDLEVNTAEALLLRLEYAIIFARSRGNTSRKVFHHRESEFAPGRHAIRKKHSFRDLSTRKHYAGEQEIEIIVNGVIKGRGVVRLLP